MTEQARLTSLYTGYKKLIPFSIGDLLIFVSPAMGSLWINGSLKSDGHGIYVVASPDDPELDKYNGVVVLVEGPPLYIHERGARLALARIVGYDSDRVIAMVRPAPGHIIVEAVQLAPGLIIDALVERADGEALYYTACYLPDWRYDPRILDALLDRGDGETLYRAARDLPDSRYDPRIVAALVARGNMDVLYFAPHIRVEKINEVLRKCEHLEMKETFPTYDFFCIWSCGSSFHGEDVLHG